MARIKVEKKTSVSHEELLKQKQIKLDLVAKFMGSPLFFAKEVVPHLLVNDTPDFHKELYHMVPTTNRMVVAAPRGFAKSTILSVIYPIWLVCTIYKKNIMIISASETLAVGMLRKIKMELETNELIKAIYGDLKTDKWSESHIVTKTGVSIMARGAGGQIRGFRPDCIILDDIETDESVESEEQRKKLKDWIFKACLNTLPPDTGQFLMVGSVISVLCILNELLNDDNAWMKRRYKAYTDGVQEEGHELWPALWNHSRLQQRKREIGSFRFSSEFMNDPISDETAPIKPNQIRYWEGLPSQLSCVIAVDPAYSEDAKADYKVASLIGIDQNLNRYLCSYIRSHASQGEFMDAILNLWLTNKGIITAIGLPNSGVEKSFFNSFLDRANSRGLYPPVAEIKHSFITAAGQSIRAKKQRIVAALQPLFESGKYYLHRNQEEAKDELLSIGQTVHDDICFIAGTKIATPFGDKRIEDFKTGDVVITPLGIQKVSGCGFTGLSQVVDKFGLLATPNHRIVSLEYGLKSIDSLCYTDEVSKLSIKETILWRYRKLLCSMERNSTSWDRENIISLLQIEIKTGRILKDFMWRFGNFITNRKFQKAFVFTTSTITLTITTLATLCAYRIATTLNLQDVIKNLKKGILRKLDLLQLFGIGQKKAESGIENTQKILGRVLSLRDWFANAAGMNLNLCMLTPFSAQKNVLQKIEGSLDSITKQGSVLSAVQSLESTDFQKQKPAVSHADIDSFGKSAVKVYNLSVENEGLYYANGVLVSNCDTLAYAEQLLTPVAFQETKTEFHHELYVAGSKKSNYGWE